jgi:methylmalonyl-CoA mutase, N-terminal domain
MVRPRPRTCSPGLSLRKDTRAPGGPLEPVPESGAPEVQAAGAAAGSTCPAVATDKVRVLVGTPGRDRAIIRGQAVQRLRKREDEHVKQDKEAGATSKDRPGSAVPDAGRERWRSTTRAKAISRSPERQDRFETTSGIEIKDLYTPADAAALDEDRDLGRPGEYPYTRGVQPTMYRGRLWTMRQYAGFSTAEDTNRRFRYLLEQGQTGLSVAFDLPTQMGYDSDSPMAEGEVGRVGVPISSLADMEVLLDDLPLGTVSTSMTINASAGVLLALYVAVAQKQGVARAQVSGTTQNDILKEYIARGTYIFPPRPSMRLVTDIFEFCSKELPRWNTISISGYHMREAGATAAQELAFTLADAIAYVEAAVERGLEIDAFADRLSFFFAAWSELFEEVAKFRAARRMWARIVKDRFGATDPRSMACRYHVQTAGSSLTAQSVDNNVVRTTVQALAAVLGGAQSLHTNSRDEALALPTEESARLALRTQQILAYESGVTETPDPLAGSYYVESLTDSLEKAANEYLAEIDRLGGTLAAIETGYQQRQIQESSYQVQRAIENGTKVVVGVNKFRDESKSTPNLQRIDPEAEKRQVARVQKVRAERDPRAWEASMRRLEECARGSENVMPAMIEAVKAYATVGEVCDLLREIWGEYRETITV